MNESEYNCLLNKATFSPQINSVIEVYQDQDAEHSFFEHKELVEELTEDWCKQRGAYSPPALPVIDWSLRLLLLRRDPAYEFVEEAPLPFNRTTFTAMIETLELPKHFIRVFHEGWSVFSRFTMTKSPESNVIGFVLGSYPSASVNFTLAISYNTKTRCTRGILAGLSAFDIEILAGHLRSMNTYCRNPMLLPLILCLMSTDRDGQQFDDVSSELAGLEQMSGLQYMKIFRFPIKESQQSNQLEKTESTSSKCAGPRDYELQVRQLNEINTSIRMFEIRIASVLRMLSSLSDFLQELKVLELQENLHDLYSCALSEQIQFLKSTNESVLSDIRFQSYRAKSQINVVYSLINQRDSKLNLAVAADSRSIALATKRDSSAMKTISFLSILFLPGTFFATLFSMTMFDWDDSAQVVSDYIWVYAAVTLPVTIGLLGTWIIYMRRKGRHDKAIEEEAALAYSSF